MAFFECFFYSWVNLSDVTISGEMNRCDGQQPRNDVDSSFSILDAWLGNSRCVTQVRRNSVYTSRGRWHLCKLFLTSFAAASDESWCATQLLAPFFTQKRSWRQNNSTKSELRGHCRIRKLWLICVRLHKLIQPRFSKHFIYFCFLLFLSFFLVFTKKRTLHYYFVYFK